MKKAITDKNDNNNAGSSAMHIFKKSSKLDNVLYDVRGPVVEEAARMEERGTHVLKLNIGNPAPFGFRTPDEVIYDMSQQLSDCEGYSPSQGLFSARKAIMQYSQIKKLPNVTINDIYTGNGVSELINLCMSALLDNGDEILIPSPDYPLWTACATLAGGKAVHYICDEQSDWYPDIEDMRRKITDRTKALVIINPNNPTGALYPKEVLQKIVDLAREHHLIIFSDEIYDRLVMDGKEHISIASLAPDLFCVTFSGLSKSHMIAGFRIGWMVLSGNKAIAKDYIEGIKMLSIPIGPVPISLTNFAIYLSLYLLDWKKGTISYILYLLLGLVGLPVFSGFTGGIGKLAGPTGGYIIGFIPMAIIAGIVIDKFSQRWIQILGMIVGTAICYAFGTAWFCIQAGYTVSAALAVCVIPFIPADLIKMVIAMIIGPEIRKRLGAVAQ